MPEPMDALVRDLRASRERLLAVVAGVTEEQFKRRPTPPPSTERGTAAAGDWSIAEVLAHLLASEQRLGDRLESLMAGNEATAPLPTDDERNAEARQGRLVPVPQIIHGLLAARRRMEHVLTQSGAIVAPDAVALAVQTDVIEHESAHRDQIEAVKASLGAARAARE